MKNTKRIGILAAVFLLMGCSAQGTTLSEDKPQDALEIQSDEIQKEDDQAVGTMEDYERRRGKFSQRKGSFITEPTEDQTLLTQSQAEQMIRNADNAIQTIMKKADVYKKEAPEEEEVRTYLSNYFDSDILDYVLYVYQIGVEDGKCSYEYYSHYCNFYMDTQESIEMIDQGDGYCDMLVSFVHRWNREWDEDQVTVRIEQKENGHWVITKMNHWYNDFRYYYMPEMDYWPEYMTEDMAAWMIQEFGTDDNGEKIQLCVRSDENGFILPDSGERKMEEQEITSLSRYEKFLAVQEIYARKGKKFDDVMLYGYFQTKPWYKPYQQVFEEKNLTEAELYNIEQLKVSSGLGELAQPDYGNRYREEGRMDGQPLCAEEASCIIGGAFDGLDRIFTAKAENLIGEMSDDVETCYSLGEYSAEPRLREYVSAWFSEEVFDYLMGMCAIMHGVTWNENGQCGLSYGLTPPMDVYVPDDFSSVVIKDFRETECTVTVVFWNQNGFSGDPELTSEGEFLLRKEGDRWIIEDISEPHYDEYYVFLHPEVSGDKGGS